MKTLPIRCGPRYIRQIRAIAWAGAEEGARDVCPLHQFITKAKDDYPEEWEELAALLGSTAASGPPKNPQRFNSIGDGMYEFKTWKLRVFCFLDDGNIIVCAHGYYKQGQKAPKRELTRAKSFRDKYLQAKQQGTLTHV